MTLANSATRYGSVTKAFHWLIAAGILAMIPLGLVADRWPYDTSAQLATKATLFQVHKTIGVTLFFLALARIGWALTQPKPAPLHPERRLETLAADTAHWLLYGSLVAVPLSGWVHHAATEGFAPIWWPFGQNLPFVPISDRVAGVAASLHHLFLYVLFAALAAHVAGALKHHFLDRDRTLARMLPGRTEAGRPGVAHGLLAPLALALLVWGGALGGGAALGYFATADAAEPPTPQLAEVQSEWTVTEGTLAIFVQQMGQEVEGSFADWTAEIAFEEQDQPGKAGEVTVTISVPSVTLGGVTSQAKGPDFFAAETHPTATFVADIVKASDDYEAQGTLTLKDESVPVTLPFQLTLDGDTARMEGRTTLDRRNYGIGQSMEDESQVGFDVGVRVSLTAVRGD